MTAGNWSLLSEINLNMRSPDTFLGTPVQLLGNTNCQSANHTAATQWI